MRYDPLVQTMPLSQVSDDVLSTSISPTFYKASTLPPQTHQVHARSRQPTPPTNVQETEALDYLTMLDHVAIQYINHVNVSWEHADPLIAQLKHHCL